MLQKIYLKKSLNICIWIGCNKFSLLPREYFSSAVIEKTNSPEILDITKRDILKLDFCQSD